LKGRDCGRLPPERVQGGHEGAPQGDGNTQKCKYDKHAVKYGDKFSK